MSATLRVTAMTHPGAVRADNEDALLIGAFTACGVTLADPVVWEAPLVAPVVVAVADGMGGHAAGDVAAAHTVRTLAADPPQDEAEIAAALCHIDSQLQAMAQGGPGGPGATVAGIVVGPDGGLRFGVGDSRVYHQHGGYVAQISTDDRGPTGGLTQCLGGRTDGSSLRTDVEPLAGAGRWLLCSDGLSDLVSDDALEKLLNSSDDPQRVVKALWAAAMNASGRDNISIVLIEIEPERGAARGANGEPEGASQL